MIYLGLNFARFVVSIEDIEPVPNGALFGSLVQTNQFEELFSDKSEYKKYDLVTYKGIECTIEEIEGYNVTLRLASIDPTDHIPIVI